MPGSANALHVATGKLAEYIDRLWAGRSTAPALLSGMYAERLAQAARMASIMIRPHISLPALVDLLQQEDRAFPRDLLATDAGREARSAFNALSRAIRSLKEVVAPDEHVPFGPEMIVGEQLSAVSFVQDYLELAFDGPRFTVLCAVRVKTPSGMGRSGEVGFRDRLCELIGRTVASFALDSQTVSIELDGCGIEVDLTAGSAGPEKLLFDDGHGLTTVWN